MKQRKLDYWRQTPYPLNKKYFNKINVYLTLLKYGSMASIIVLDQFTRNVS